MTRAIAVLALVSVVACSDDGSLGDITETGGGESAGTSESGTSTSTASTTAATGTGATESSTTAADTGSTTADTGSTTDATSGSEGSTGSTGPDPGPDNGQIDDMCAPDDGPATELMFGGLGSCPMDEPSIRLVFYSGAPAVSSYTFESQADGFGEVVDAGVPVAVTAAWVEILALGGGVASGSYEVITEDAQHLAADFTDIPYCEGGFPCG